MAEAVETGVDAAELSVELAAAGAALEAFAAGPAKVAGEAMEASFAKAGRSIESELARVARTGEADLERLAVAIAATLAQLALKQAFGGSAGGGEAASPVNVVMNFAGGAGASDAVGSSNQIAAAVARAVRRGARFS